MGKVKIGVVGCGDAAQRFYLPEFHRIEERALLVAVCDREEARAVAARRRFGARASYRDVQQFLRESGADMVLNLTPITRMPRYPWPRSRRAGMCIPKSRWRNHWRTPRS